MILATTNKEQSTKFQVLITMPLSTNSLPLANVLDSLTVEGASELTEQLENKALKCFACGHRCLIKEGKRGICKVRFNEGGHLRVPSNYVAALACDPTGEETVLPRSARLRHPDVWNAWLRSPLRILPKLVNVSSAYATTQPEPTRVKFHQSAW